MLRIRIHPGEGHVVQDEDSGYRNQLRRRAREKTLILINNKEQVGNRNGQSMDVYCSAGCHLLRSSVCSTLGCDDTG